MKDTVVEQVSMGVSREKVARQAGCSLKSVNNWVAQATARGKENPDSAGEGPDASTIIAAQAARIRRLEKENEILEKAAAFFAAKTMN